MPTIAALTTFTPNTQIKSAEVNTNFSTLRTTLNTYGVFTDVARNITAVYTFDAAPVFTLAQTFPLAVTVTAGGITVTGNSTITGTLGGLTGLTVASGGATITGNSTLTGTLGGLTGLTVASGGAAITGNSSVTGNLNVTGTITGGTITVPAAGVQAGTFGAGSFVFQGGVTADSGEVKARTVRATRQTQSGAGGTANFANGNHVRHTMTGNGTLTLSGGTAGGVYTLEVLQDGTGGRTVSWSGAVWAGAIAPTSTTTPNRKDVYTFFYDGTNYLGVQFGKDFASTA